MRISDWSSDVCSSDLPAKGFRAQQAVHLIGQPRHARLKNLQPSARQRARWQAADQVGNLRAHGASDFRQERKECAFSYRTDVEVTPERWHIEESFSTNRAEEQRRGEEVVGKCGL